jgi:excisionase family DNA binding protein
MAWCWGLEEGCDAEEDLCLCGVLRCLVHGHVDEGDDPWCRWWVEDPRARQGWSHGDAAAEAPLFEDLDLSAWEVSSRAWTVNARSRLALPLNTGLDYRMLRGVGEFLARPVWDQQEKRMPVDDRLWSIREVANYLAMSQDTIHDWIKSGRLRASRIGRYWRIRPRDLEAFIDDPPPLHPRASAE